METRYSQNTVKHSTGPHAVRPWVVQSLVLKALYRSTTACLIAAATQFSVGCASAPKTKTSENQAKPPSSEVSVPAPSPSATPAGPEAYGPPNPHPPDMSAPQPNYGPEPIALKPIVLVLGPGLARGFALAGFLEALGQAKIPIGAIYGTEMGALFGTLYSNAKSINEFEWHLLKIKPELFYEKETLLARFLNRPNPGSDLEKVLNQILGNQDLSSPKVSLHLVAQKTVDAHPWLLERGNAVTNVRAALATKHLFSTVKIDEIEAQAGTTQVAFMISEARKYNLGAVVYIDVFDHSLSAANIRQNSKLSKLEKQLDLDMTESAARSADELKQADLVIQPELKGIGYLDYEKHTEAVFQGKKAAILKMTEIKHLVGLPDNDVGILK